MKSTSTIKRAVVGALLATLVASARAQGLDGYLKLRHKYGITRAAGVQALDAFVGSRIVEIQGTIKGNFTAGKKAILLLERPGGSTIDVEAEDLPSWLEGNELKVRLIVAAERQDSAKSIHAHLLSAAPEGPIASIEAKAESAERARAERLRNRPVVKPPKRAIRNWTLPYSQVVPIYAGFIKHDNKRLTDAEALRIARGIVDFSIQYGVDARLIMAMVMVESDFDPNSTSHSGARGLGQLMPGTAKWMGVSDVYDSIDNLYGTVKLVRHTLDQYNRQTGDSFRSLVLMLAAYNAGEGAVKRHGGVPPFRETQRYVKRVIDLYRRFSGRG